MSRRVAMLVSNACAPDRRVLREGQTLVAQGHHVTVIAWDREGRYPARELVPSHSAAPTPGGDCVPEPAGGNSTAGVQIERIGVASAYGAGLRRMGQWPAFARQASARLRQDDWDAVHCHDLDTLPIGYGYTRRRSVPLVFDAHESYPDFAAPRLPGGAVLGLRLMERFLLPRVDAVITVGDLLAEHYRRWARPVVVVRNCPAEPHSAPPGPGDATESSAAAALRVSWGFDGIDHSDNLPSPGGVSRVGDVELVVCYVGGFTHGRVILPLIEAVKEDPSLGLVLVGEGPQAPSILAAAEGVDRIAYVGWVPADQVVNVMRAADVVYYGLRSDFPNNRFSSPNALYSALAAGRPLLTTNVGEIAQVVRTEECGVILEAPTAEAIGAGLAELRAPGVRATMSRNAHRAAESKYNWPAAEAELLDLYRNLWGDV